MGRITELIVNEARYPTDADANRSLLRVLRDDLDLTGTKYGCGEAQCGACLVLIDGVRTPSCITPVSEASGKSVTTIEGLAKNGDPHPIQTAFLRHGAFQCGYCTPGMIIASLALLRENPDPSDSEIRNALEKNLCRCGAHTRIVAAVRTAARMLRGEPETPETPETPAKRKEANDA